MTPGRRITGNFLRSRARAWVLAWAGWCGLAALAARADDPVPPGLQLVTYLGQNYWVRTVDLHTEDLRMFWRDDSGQPLRDFKGLDAYTQAHHVNLVFAANAGMFDPQAAPVGLLVQNGHEMAPLNLNDGTGNFFMKPNGVFLVTQSRQAMVIESSTYVALMSPAVWATQSGPLLVYSGSIHPDFVPGSANRKLRSGVGVRADGTIVFALSRSPVNFYDFAGLFLHTLNCPNALYLDGEISAFYVPGLKDNVDHSFGPMIGVVK